MAADAVKIIVHDASDNVLVLRRSSTHPHWPFEVDFPGGDVDDNESLVQAAVRELQEETGLVSEPHELEFVESWPNHHGTHHHLYRLRLTNSQPVVQISWEHDEHTWLSLQQLFETTHPAVTDRFNTSIVAYLRAGE